mmetsp:Transcript_5145/g.21130  ORF Transcript_5145/g.21130 Transcript_5145/m.21130 type:complete len:533 (-) Transcript_5145:966-2564(-)
MMMMMTKDEPHTVSAHQKAPPRYEMTSIGLAEVRAAPKTTTLDMFDVDDVGEASMVDDGARDGRRATAAQLLAGEVEEEQANWDDAEGYYVSRPGEVIDGRYRVLGVVGRGVFSSVLRATEDPVVPKAGAGATSSSKTVAVKMIRNNETMAKAAQKEVEILRLLTTPAAAAGKGSSSAKEVADRSHVIRLLGATKHRGHTALVFESMAMNLREALRKYGKHVGINVQSVRSYARQLVHALRHLARHGVVHADVKPDNILVSENNAVVKLCDFGSAFRPADELCDPSPYLVSRFYRAPEIILGLKYDHRVDLWAVGCCLFELYCGRVMFPGVDNNNMLLHMQDLKGRFPNKMLRAHVRAYTTLLLLDPHFLEGDGGTFKFQHRVRGAEGASSTAGAAGGGAPSEHRLALIDVVKPKRRIRDVLLEKKAGADDRALVVDLADLLDQIHALNPDHRPALADCAKHKFIVGRAETNPAPTDKAAAAAAKGGTSSTTTSAAAPGAAAGGASRTSPPRFHLAPATSTTNGHAATRKPP